MKKYIIIFLGAAVLNSCGSDSEGGDNNNTSDSTTTNVDSVGADLFNNVEDPSTSLGTPSVELNTDDEKLSYCFGYQTAGQIANGIIKPNNEAIKAAFEDFNKGKVRISKDRSMELLNGYFQSGKSKTDSSLSSKSSKLVSKKDTICYAYGVIVGDAISTNFDWMNSEIFFIGYYDKVDGKNDVEDKSIVMLQQKLMGERMSKEGTDFLKKNKERSEVTELPSGLQYEIIKKGDGPKPKASEKVKVHYHGTLIDGTVFDSSVERGQPATFGVTQVIKGWVEALQLMPVGSKWKLYIPYDLAYGERGSPPKIAPYSALIFEVELLSIEN